jgi:broad specificity phosphatase PhoE
MDRILLIRHAQADGDDGSDPALSSVGVDQAALLVERLAGEGVRELLHGPRRRARQTAELVGAGLALRPTSTDLLEDRTPVPSELRWSDYPAHRWDFLREVPADERDEDGAELSAAWSQLTAPRAWEQGSGDGGTRVFITHAFVVGWFVCRALDAPPAAWMLLPVANASITELTRRSTGEYSVTGFNDVGHLRLS